MLVLNKLNPEDIDEKIRLNKEQGVNIYMLRDMIREEYKDFKWTAIRAEVQCQAYVEQLAHIEKRIMQEESLRANPLLEKINSLEAEIKELKEAKNQEAPAA